MAGDAQAAGCQAVVSAARSAQLTRPYWARAQVVERGHAIAAVYRDQVGRGVCTTNMRWSVRDYGYLCWWATVLVWRILYDPTRYDHVWAAGADISTSVQRSRSHTVERQ